MELMVIDNDVNRCKFFDHLNIDRVFIDLEKIGKDIRQKGLNTVKSNHNISDIGKIKSAVVNSKVLVRINPFYSGTINEIDQCIEAGADIIMLPYFRRKEEVLAFIEAVGGRVRTCLLLETAAAFFRIEEIVAIDGIDEIHIGLNDLYLDLGLDFILEVYRSPLLEAVCCLIRDKGISLGIGGVASIGSGLVDGKDVLQEIIRLGGERVILSRSFNKDNLDVFRVQLSEFRSFLNEILADNYNLENNFNRRIFLKKIESISKLEVR